MNHQYGGVFSVRICCQNLSPPWRIQLSAFHSAAFSTFFLFIRIRNVVSNFPMRKDASNCLRHVRTSYGVHCSVFWSGSIFAKVISNCPIQSLCQIHWKNVIAQIELYVRIFKIDYEFCFEWNSVILILFRFLMHEQQSIFSQNQRDEGKLDEYPYFIKSLQAK